MWPKFETLDVSQPDKSWSIAELWKLQNDRNWLTNSVFSVSIQETNLHSQHVLHVANIPATNISIEECSAKEPTRTDSEGISCFQWQIKHLAMPCTLGKNHPYICSMFITLLTSQRDRSLFQLLQSLNVRCS